MKAVQQFETNWFERYLLGAISEVDEILRELNWKPHRREKSVNWNNVGEELADLTKYVFCLWQEGGFSAKEMLDHLYRKGESLEQEFRLEFFPPSSKKVIITDLDGTVADYRTGFQQWLGIEHEEIRSLNGDLDTGMDWLQYNGLKEEFERTGGYSTLPVYDDAANLLSLESLNGASVIVITARPVNQFQRIKQDTHVWLRANEIPADHVLFGREERLLTLARLGQKENKMVLLEDDPVNAMRAANSGFKVLLRAQPYNQETKHANIRRYEYYPETVEW